MNSGSQSVLAKSGSIDRLASILLCVPGFWQRLMTGLVAVWRWPVWTLGLRRCSGCHAQRRDAEDFAPKPQNGDIRSRRVQERTLGILTVWGARKDITLVELSLALAKMGLAVSVAGLHRFLCAGS